MRVTCCVASVTGSGGRQQPLANWTHFYTVLEELGRDQRCLCSFGLRGPRADLAVGFKTVRGLDIQDHADLGDTAKDLQRDARCQRQVTASGGADSQIGKDVQGSRCCDIKRFGGEGGDGSHRRVTHNGGMLCEALHSTNQSFL